MLRIPQGLIFCIFLIFFECNENSCIFALVIKAPPFFLEWTWPSEDGFICLYAVMPNVVSDGVKTYYKPEKWR